MLPACVSLQVIIKQEPGEVPTQQQQQQQQMASTVTTQQQPAATASHQFVSVKGGHMISMSAQKQTGGGSGAATNKVGLSYKVILVSIAHHSPKKLGILGIWVKYQDVPKISDSLCRSTFTIFTLWVEGGQAPER